MGAWIVTASVLILHSLCMGISHAPFMPWFPLVSVLQKALYWESLGGCKAVATPSAGQMGLSRTISLVAACAVVNLTSEPTLVVAGEHTCPNKAVYYKASLLCCFFGVHKQYAEVFYDLSTLHNTPHHLEMSVESCSHLYFLGQSFQRFIIFIHVFRTNIWLLLIFLILCLFSNSLISTLYFLPIRVCKCSSCSISAPTLGIFNLSNFTYPYMCVCVCM